MTSGPTASTTPAPSWPRTIGTRSDPRCPSRQVEVGVADARGGDADAHLPRTGGSRITSSTDIGSPMRRSTAARTRIGSFIATRCASRASRSSVTPRPGPSGGRIVPSAAIGIGRGNIRSRRSGPQAGGSNGTSMNGTVDTAIARWRFAIMPTPFVHVCGLNVWPAASATAAIRRHPPIPPASITSGCTTSTPPRRIRSRPSWSVRTISPAATRRDVRPRSTA